MGNDIFSAHIKRLRKNSGLTMDKFAELLDTKKSSVNMWENNGVVPRNDMLLKISTEFNISLDELLGNYERSDYIENQTLSYLQRNLKKLDDDALRKAENILKTVFVDIFEDDEEDDDDI